MKTKKCITCNTKTLRGNGEDAAADIQFCVCAARAHGDLGDRRAQPALLDSLQRPPAKTRDVGLAWLQVLTGATAIFCMGGIIFGVSSIYSVLDRRATHSSALYPSHRVCTFRCKLLMCAPCRCGAGSRGG